MAVTIYGVCAVTFMMVMYALERRGRGFVLGFAFGLRAVEHLRVSVGRVALRRRRIDLGGRGGSAVRAASRCLNRLRAQISPFGVADTKRGANRSRPLAVDPLWLREIARRAGSWPSS